MNVENITLCGEFLMIMTNLESDNTNANIAGVNWASTLIAGGMLPEPGLMLRLVTGLASYLSKSEHDNTFKKVAHSTLLSIRAAINRNNMNMDPSVCSDTLEAIQCCLMDGTFRRVQRQGVMVRLGSANEQLTALKVIRMFLHRALVNITDARCVAAFASLMLSPYAIVQSECQVSLLSLALFAPGFIFFVARAYFYEVKRLPPRSSLISNVVGMLDTLENISLTMAGREEFTLLWMC
jgi:coatomer subunit beta